MAPTVTVPMIHSMEHLPLNNKLRKPLVEKLRRDRINNSIEHIKTLLGQEFLKQHPDSKQEKADILEMTVHFLKQKMQQHPSCSTAANEGYSRCMQEAVNFLSQCEVQTQSQRRLLSHFLHKLTSVDQHQSTRVQPQPSSPIHDSSSKVKTPGCNAIWRPW